MGKGTTVDKKSNKKEKKGASVKAPKSKGPGYPQAAKSVVETLKSTLDSNAYTLMGIRKALRESMSVLSDVKMTPSQQRAVAEALLAELGPFSDCNSNITELVNRIKNLGKPPVVVHYKPNKAYPAEPLAAFKLFKKMYKEDPEHEGATNDEAKDAWKEVKSDKKALEKLDQTVRVNKWRRACKIYELAKEGKAVDMVPVEEVVHPPAESPVMGPKSERTLATTIRNRYKKKDKEISDAKLEKKVQEEREKDHKRYERHLRWAAKQTGMSVDELRVKEPKKSKKEKKPEVTSMDVDE